MAKYLVSYDLAKGGESDYPELMTALRQDGAVKILYSEWLLNSPQTAKTIADRYLRYMDLNDRIFVLRAHWSLCVLESHEHAGSSSEPVTVRFSGMVCECVSSLAHHHQRVSFSGRIENRPESYPRVTSATSGIRHAMQVTS
jgi:hypothetical protein